MRLFILPHNKSELTFLNALCLNLSLPPSTEWTAQHFDCIVSELVQLPQSAPVEQPIVNSPAFETELKKIGAIIIFYRFNQDLIKKIVGHYKKNGKWPIFAVITRTSLEMSLKCLIDHLLFDRNEENEIRQKQR